MRKVSEEIKELLAVDSVSLVDQVQELWSGYGMIERYQLPDNSTIIAKHICFPDSGNHPRGWNTNLSNLRKIKSYDVEVNWYELKHEIDTYSYFPKVLEVKKSDREILILMEDLQSSGFVPMQGELDWSQIQACIQWLAYFHVKFLSKEFSGLWETGTYWHLETRPDELEALDDLPLKNAAKAIDEKLNSANFQTIVHGDAKAANFCVDKNDNVAAVDFQYIGKGVGVKDLAYFVGSIFYESDCEKHEKEILDFYFQKIQEAISYYKVSVDFEALYQEWNELYYVAWADFHRFLKGWSPGHWKINSYSERVTREVIKNLK